MSKLKRFMALFSRLLKESWSDFNEKISFKRFAVFKKSFY